MTIQISNPKRYHDLAKWFQKEEEGMAVGKTYVDFEGLASGKGIQEAVETAMADRGMLGPDYEEHEILVRDLMIHLAYEDRDQGDEEPNHDKLVIMADTLIRVLGARYWMLAEAKES